MSKTNLVLIMMQHYFGNSSTKQHYAYLSIAHREANDKIFTILWLNAFLLLSRNHSCHPVTIITSSIIIRLSYFPPKGFAWVTNLPNLCRMRSEICSHKSNREWRNLLPLPLEHWFSWSDADCTSVLTGLWEICIFFKSLYVFFCTIILNHSGRQVFI